MKYYCIHHKPAFERKEYIVNNYCNTYGIKIKWIEGFLPECDLIINHQQITSKHSANGKFLNNAELSCYYKHKFALDLISLSNEYGMIIEDDIYKPNFDFIRTSNLFVKLMEEAGCDILFVGSFANHDMSFNEPTIICNNQTKSRCAHAYIVSPLGAKSLAQCLNEITAPLDWQLSYCIDSLKLKSCWSYPHLYQRTEKKYIKSLLRS